MRKMFSRDNIGPHAATQVPEEWPCCLDCDFIGTRFDGCVSSAVLAGTCAYLCAYYLRARNYYITRVIVQ